MLKLIALLLLAAVAWLLNRLIFVVNSYREDLADINRQLAELRRNAPKTARTEPSRPEALGTEKKVSAKADQPVSINNASKTRLQTLPKVGAVTAQRIIDARPFATLEGLLKVEGITPELFARLQAQIEL